MKLTTLLLAASLSVTPAMADEGMWTLFNLPNAVYRTMTEEGCKLSYSDLYHGEKALKNAVVNFSGYCSGVVVSPNGLVFTNHHCGFEAIRSHSTVEHDYMLHGFYAKSYEEELPNKDMFVSFMIREQDVTDSIVGKGFYGLNDQQKEKMLNDLEERLNRKAKEEDKSYHVVVQPFYEGNRFYAITYQDFRDLRLVFAIPKSMGKFGGETDNWMWPRQTCDFAVFRIYADPKTNGPAEYSKDNVPYRPKHWAPVSMQGYKEGDFSMTVGYPGSTSRYLSSYGILERRNADNAVRAQARGVRQEVMKRHMNASEAVRIKYDSKYAQSANYWKNSIGMNKCIDSIALAQTKADYEARIGRFVDSTGYLKGDLRIDSLKYYYDKRFAAWHDFMEYRENLRPCVLVNRALQAYTHYKENQKAEKPVKTYVLPIDTATWDLKAEKDIMAAMLKNYRKHILDSKSLPAFYTTIDRQFRGDYVKYVDYLWTKSRIAKIGAKIPLTDKKFWTKDPAAVMAVQLSELIKTLGDKIGSTADAIERQERLLCAAKLKMEEDMPHYSDANFSMRMSYGQVGGFLLNGKPSGYYTTAESIVEKMNSADVQPDYQAEPIMKELLSAKDFGAYTDKETGKMQLCFLTNNDITGGNSGSPMFNGKGELIGLAFDGNWDSLASDLLFDKHLARCIGVDIRFVLFMMDKWGHADRLIQEINPQ